jgi:hypothetical protein
MLLYDIQCKNLIKIYSIFDMLSRQKKKKKKIIPKGFFFTFEMTFLLY